MKSELELLQRCREALASDDRYVSELLDDIDSHLALTPTPTQEGMVMVPREPTQAMLTAGYQQYCTIDKRGYSAWQDHLAVYKAMLAAAEPKGGE